MQSCAMNTNYSTTSVNKAALSVTMPSTVAQTVTPLHHIIHALPLPELPLPMHRTNVLCTKLTLNDEEERQTSTFIEEAAHALSKDDNCTHFLHYAFAHERDKLSTLWQQEKQEELLEELSTSNYTSKRNKSASIAKVARDATVSVCNWLEDECMLENELEQEEDHHLQRLQVNKIQQVNTDKRNTIQHASTRVKKLSSEEQKSVQTTTTENVMIPAQEVRKETVNGAVHVNLESKEKRNTICENICESEEVTKMESNVDEISLEKTTTTAVAAATKVQEEDVATKDNILPLQSTEIDTFMSILKTHDKYTLEDLQRFVKWMTIAHMPFATFVNAEKLTSFVEILLEQCQVTNTVEVGNQRREQLQDKECNNAQEQHDVKEEKQSERVVNNEFTWRHALHASALLWTVNRWREHLLLAGNTTSTDKSNMQQENCYISDSTTIITTAVNNLPLPSPALRSCVMSTLIDAFYHIVHNTHHLMTRLHNEEIHDYPSCYNNTEKSEKEENGEVKLESSTSNRLVSSKEDVSFNTCINWRKWAEYIRMFARSFAALLRIAHSDTELITHDVWLINDVECDRIEQICTYALFCVPTLCEKTVYCEYTSYVMESIVKLYRCVYRYEHDKNNSENNCSSSNDVDSIHPRRFFAHILPSPHLLEETWSEAILIYSSNSSSIKQNSQKLNCTEDKKFTLITICMLSAVQSLFFTRHCSFAINKESTEQIIKDASKLHRTCAAWANGLWHHFLCTPNTMHEDKEMLMIRCNVINCIFKELSMLISCPAWPAANVLLHECVNVFSREVHASIAHSVARCSKNRCAPRNNKRKLKYKKQAKTCKELPHQEEEEEKVQLDQHEQKVEMLKCNKVSTKNKKKKSNTTAADIKKECTCEEDEENDNYKDISNHNVTTDVQNTEVNKNNNFLHIAAIDAIAEVIIELIIERTQILSKYTVKNATNTQLSELEANDKCLQVFAQHISEPLARHECKVQRNTVISTSMMKNDQFNNLHDHFEYKDDEKAKSLQTILEFIFSTLIERSKRQIGNGSNMEKCTSIRSKNSNNKYMENDNNMLYQHLLSWIACYNVSCVIDSVYNDKYNDTSKTNGENGDSGSVNRTQNDSADKCCSFIQVALHAIESVKRKEVVLRSHATPVCLREQMEQELQQQQQHSTKQELKVKVNGAILVTQLTLPESMLSRHMEEQLIYFLLSLLQCSYEANEVNEESNDDDETSADNKDNETSGKHVNKFRVINGNTKTNDNNSKGNNKNEPTAIADSLVKRIIYHFTRLCMCDRTMTHFIWSQLKSFVRSSNARIREAVVPLITFLIQDCLTNLSYSQEESPLTTTNCNDLHTQNANLVTEMISTLLCLLEDRSVMVVTRVISSFHVLLFILDRFENYTRCNELQTRQQQKQYSQENILQSAESTKQDHIISTIERDQLLLFIQYKLLKCFAETKHTRHQNDIAHLFVKRWLSMLNTEQDDMHGANSLENNINRSTINASNNHHSNENIMCYNVQSTTTQLPTKSSLSSHVLNSHAKLAREWVTLITKLAATSSTCLSDNTLAASASIKTTRTQFGSTLFPLPVITKEHPFCQLLSLLQNKSSEESRKLPHYVSEAARQNLTVQQRCYGGIVIKAKNNNINFAKKKNDFTIEEIEHLLRSVSRAVWTRFTCCVSANDTFSCLSTVHVIVMINASSVCQLVPYMLPYLSLSSEQNPLRHSSSDLYGGVLLQLCQILQILLIDYTHRTEYIEKVYCKENKSIKVSKLSTSNVMFTDSDDCISNSARRIISKDKNINKLKSKTDCNTLSFTTLDALSGLFNSIIARYVGVYQQRIIVAACGALTALIPLGDHHPSAKITTASLNPNQVATTETRYSQSITNMTTMDEVIPISPYLLMCYKLMDGYYTRIYLLLSSLSTDCKNIAYIQRFLFLLSEFLRNYRGWTSATLQKELQDVGDVNMSSTANVNANSSYEYNNNNSNSVAVHTTLTGNNAASQNMWEGNLSQNTGSALAAGDGICSNVFALVKEIMRCASADTLTKLHVILMRVMSSLCMLKPQTYFLQCKEYIAQSLLPEASIALQIQGLTLLRDFLRDEAERVYSASTNITTTMQKPLSTSSSTQVTHNDEQSTQTHRVDSTVVNDTTILSNNNEDHTNRNLKNEVSKLELEETEEEQCSTESKCKTKRNNCNSVKTNANNAKQKRHTVEELNTQSESESGTVNEYKGTMEDKLQLLSSKFDFADENSGMAAWLMQHYHESITTLCIHSISKMVRELCMEILCTCANDGLLPPAKYLPSLIALCNDVDDTIRSHAQRFLCKSTELVQCSESLPVAAVPGILHGYVLGCSCKADVIENISQCADYATTTNNLTSFMSYHTLFTLLTYRDRLKVRHALLRYFYETDKLSAWYKTLPLIRNNMKPTSVRNGINSSNSKMNGTHLNNLSTATSNTEQFIAQECNILSFFAYLSVVITFSSLSSASHSELTNLSNECITGVNLHGESALEILTSACKNLSEVQSEVILDKVSVASSEGGLTKTRNGQKSKKKSKKEVRLQEHKEMEEKQSEEEYEYSYNKESTKECTHHGNGSDETNAADRSVRQVIAESQCAELLENLSLERLALSEAVSVVLLHYMYTTIHSFHSANGMRNKEKPEHNLEYQPSVYASTKGSNRRINNNGSTCPSFTTGQVQVALLFLRHVRVFVHKVAPLVSYIDVNFTDDNIKTKNIHLTCKHCLRSNSNNEKKRTSKVDSVNCTAINEVSNALHFLRDELQRTLCDDNLQNMHVSTHRHCTKQNKTKMSNAKTERTINKSKRQAEEISKRGLKQSQRKRKRSVSSSSSESSESSVSTWTSSLYSSDEDNDYSSSSSSSSMSSSEEEERK